MGRREDLLHCRGQFNPSRSFDGRGALSLPCGLLPIDLVSQYVAQAYAGVEIQTRFGYEGSSQVDRGRPCEKPYCFRGGYP